MEKVLANLEDLISVSLCIDLSAENLTIRITYYFM